VKVGAMPPAEIDLDGTPEIRFGRTTLRVIPTPGHTPGHVAFYEPQAKALFTGDTLFRESIRPRRTWPGRRLLVDHAFDPRLAVFRRGRRRCHVLRPGHRVRTTTIRPRTLLPNPFTSSEVA